MVAPAVYKNFNRLLTKKIQMLYNDMEFLGRYQVEEVERKNDHIKEKIKNQMDCTQYCMYSSFHFHDQNGVLYALSR